VVRIYKRKNYNIYSAGKGSNAYIVYNTLLPFDKGHTHLSNYNTAKFVIGMAINKLVPSTRINIYLVDSIIRISDDKNYIDRLIEFKERKFVHKNG